MSDLRNHPSPTTNRVVTILVFHSWPTPLNWHHWSFYFARTPVAFAPSWKMVIPMSFATGCSPACIIFIVMSFTPDPIAGGNECKENAQHYKAYAYPAPRQWIRRGCRWCHTLWRLHRQASRNNPAKEGGKEQDITGKKGTIIEPSGRRVVVSKVSVTSKAHIVPFSLTTYRTKDRLSCLLIADFLTSLTL